MAIISAFIMNLGKYNEGELVGKWHDFPTTKEELTKTFREIGIDGVNYEEFFITDYDCIVDGIVDYLGEYSSLEEINFLAMKLSELSDYDLAKYEAVVETGEYCGSVKGLTNLADNIDCFDYMEDIINECDLGYYWVEDSGCYDTENLGVLSNYIDYERFGRDMRINESGEFTAGRYIRNNGDTFYEEYDGVNITSGCKVLPKRG